jgi:serine protease Do
LAEASGLKENSGALVSSVAPDGPAAKAGIQDGDVIVRFDGKEVTTMRGLPRLVSQTQIGKEVDVEVLRKGQRRTLRVTVGRLNEDAKMQPRVGKRQPPKGKGKGKQKDGDARPPGQSLMGLVLAPLTDELRTKHGLGATAKGVVVIEVDPASAAAERRVKAGDVIVEVAQEAVTSIEDIVKGIERVRTAGRTAVLLRLEDAGGDMRFVAVPIQ